MSIIITGDIVMYCTRQNQERAWYTMRMRKISVIIVAKKPQNLCILRDQLAMVIIFDSVYVVDDQLTKLGLGVLLYGG